MSIPSTVSAASVLTHPHQFSGELPIRLLPRLKDAMGSEDGSLKVQLVADRDSGFARLHGSIEGALGMKCQRCGKRYEWPLHAEVDLRLVFSEQEEKAALQGSDPYLIEGDVLPVKELVEDEVLLALPMLVRCKTCENSVAAAAEKSAQKMKAGSVAKSASDNPFAALKGKLKKQ